MSDRANESENRDEKHGQHGNKPEPGKTTDKSEREASERLDEGLEETFPSSDPVSVKITK